MANIKFNYTYAWSILSAPIKWRPPSDFQALSVTSPSSSLYSQERPWEQGVSYIVLKGSQTIWRDWQTDTRWPIRRCLTLKWLRCSAIFAFHLFNGVNAELSVSFKSRIGAFHGFGLGGGMCPRSVVSLCVSCVTD